MSSADREIHGAPHLDFHRFARIPLEQVAVVRAARLIRPVMAGAWPHASPLRENHRMTTVRSPVSVSRYPPAVVMPDLHLDTVALPLGTTGPDGVFDICPVRTHAMRCPERIALHA